jgi:hypothetical protein
VKKIQRVRAKAPHRREVHGENLGEALAATLDRFFRGRPLWHGAVWPHIADLTTEQALWRPAPDRHCIWEIVRHMCLWRSWLLEHAAGRRIENWREQNWTLPESITAAAWRADLRRLRSIQGSLRRLFQNTPRKTLLARDARGTYRTFFWLGVLAHDSYHTGQIALLRAMLGLKPVL